MTKANYYSLFICLILLFPIYSKAQIMEKITGVSVWCNGKKHKKSDFQFVKDVHAGWISIQPYAMQKTPSDPLIFNEDDNWQCIDFDVVKNEIRRSKEQGLKIFLKPHIHLDYETNEIWVGNLSFDSEWKWKTFEDCYFEYVVELARIAQSMNVELFSIGTEMGTFPVERADFWNELIGKIEAIYHGNLTYSSNFDYYQNFPFWNKLDYIGIDAYFTVDTQQTPSIDTCMANWKPIKSQLENFSVNHNKQIFFSEYGYRSTDYCAKKPFSALSSRVNLVAQANAYRALFYTFWDESWFLGGFSWLWHFDNSHPENYDNTYYSPQNKPAEHIIRKKYKSFSSLLN